ncbi:hypothetical protein HK102_004075, partial [Quaeritorhiza haematococci]
AAHQRAAHFNQRSGTEQEQNRRLTQLLQSFTTQPYVKMGKNAKFYKRPSKQEKDQRKIAKNSTSSSSTSSSTSSKSTHKQPMKHTPKSTLTNPKPKASKPLLSAALTAAATSSALASSSSTTTTTKKSVSFAPTVTKRNGEEDVDMMGVEGKGVGVGKGGKGGDEGKVLDGRADYVELMGWQRKKAPKSRKPTVLL